MAEEKGDEKERKEQLEEMIKSLPPEGSDDYLEPDICRPLKERHDECFFKWYNTEFLEGKATEAGCQPEWDAYRVCLERRLKKIDLHHLIKK